MLSPDPQFGLQGGVTKINYIADFRLYRKLLETIVGTKSGDQLIALWNGHLFPNGTTGAKRGAALSSTEAECEDLVAQLKDEQDAGSDEEDDQGSVEIAPSDKAISKGFERDRSEDSTPPHVEVEDEGSDPIDPFDPDAGDANEHQLDNDISAEQDHEIEDIEEVREEHEPEPVHRQDLEKALLRRQSKVDRIIAKIRAERDPESMLRLARDLEQAERAVAKVRAELVALEDQQVEEEGSVASPVKSKPQSKSPGENAVARAAKNTDTDTDTDADDESRNDRHPTTANRMPGSGGFPHSQASRSGPSTSEEMRAEPQDDERLNSAGGNGKPSNLNGKRRATTDGDAEKAPKKKKTKMVLPPREKSARVSRMTK